MQRLGTIGHRSAPRKKAIAAGALSLVMLVAGCTNASGGTKQSPAANHPSVSGSQAPDNSSASSSAPAPAPEISTVPDVGARTIDPADPITVTADSGTLTAVTLTNPFGKQVTGALSSDAKTWHTTEALGYSKTYRLVATAKNADGQSVTKAGRYTTVTPNNMTLPYLNTIYGSPLQNGAAYGVGMVVSVHFDEEIPNKRAAMQALQVTTTPHVDGAWYWLDNSTAHWRPQTFYQPGTVVRVDAKVYGKDLGGGLYGQSDESVQFHIGQKHFSVANAQTHKVKVWFNDKLVRVMPTSMGRGGYVQGKYGSISLWTMNGMYTVINHENPAVMSSDSYGLPANSPAGYAPEKVPFATKISIDGIYLHELDATTWAQGNTNVSHGCLNLNYDNAKWFYNNSVVGDLVQVVGSGGAPIRVDQGGDWSVPWAQWVKGGDL